MIRAEGSPMKTWFTALVLLALCASGRADQSTPAPAKGAALVAAVHVSLGMPPPFDYTVSAYSDGHVEVVQRVGYRRTRRGLEVIEKPRRRSRTASPEAIARLRALVLSPEVAALKVSYRGDVWDVPDYELDLAGASPRRMVTISRLLADDLPRPLKELIGELERQAEGLAQR
jgi:hypothetical protein